MEKKAHLEVGLDRISDLPEPIRKHILSYMSTRDAVRASILSSSWRGLWQGRTSLDLSEDCLADLLTVEDLPVNDGDDDARLRREAILRMREEFYKFLDRTLESTTELEKFDLYVPGFGPELESRLEHWLDRVIGCNVKELSLEIGESSGPKYIMSKKVLGANTITKLKLDNCGLDLSNLFDTQLASLRELCLQNVHSGEEAMERLLASCPALEEFTFKSCRGLSRLEVSGLAKLEKVNVEVYSDGVSEIEIDAPNLLEFDFVNEGHFEEYSTIDIVVSACKNMKRLSLVGAPLYDSELSLIVESLPVLEDLELYHCYLLEQLEISSKSLVRLAFEYCRELLEVEINTPNLKFFHYADKDLITLRSKGPPLKLTEASIYLRADIQCDKWYTQLIKFFVNLSHAERLLLNIGLEEDVIISEKVRKKSRPPLFAVKHLMVHLRASFLKRIPVKLVEALLWLAPCPESISIYNDYIPVRKVLKFIYDSPVKGKKTCGCWRARPIHCWRHSLKKVLIDNKKGTENDAKLAAFFQKARTDTKIECCLKNQGPDKVGDMDYLFSDIDSP